MRKPMLAEDWVESQIRFPCIVQPKIDGVRGINLDGNFTGRSLKAHKNLHVTKLFSYPEYTGFDGEVAAGDITDPGLCRLTTSMLGTIKGEPIVKWHLFDYITDETVGMPYTDRYEVLAQRLKYMESTHPVSRWNLELVPSRLCHSLSELLTWDDTHLDQGLEGTIVRDPMGMHKDGRSTVKSMGLLRIKRFMEEDALVLGIEEGQVNGNEAKTNELGRTERSSHQENMTPNGMVGTLICRLLKDVPDPRTGVILLRAGQEITVSAGSMPHGDRVRFFQNPELIVGQTIKFKFFPKGIKTLPRFPTFVALRLESDRP